MGTLCFVNRRPRTWPFRVTDHMFKPEFGGERVVLVTCGEWHDDCGRSIDFEQMMAYSVFQKLLSGTYTVSKESAHKGKLIILDGDGNEVPLIGAAREEAPDVYAREP